MKWKGRRQSGNVEDRRGSGAGKKALLGGGAIGIIVMLLTIFGGETGQQLAPILNQLQQSTQQADNSTQRELTEEEKQLGQFVSTVFADTEDIWGKIFRDNGSEYQQPSMVLFTGQVSTGCGDASSAVGPFYCPADQKVYMDLDFFEELKNRFGAQGGDFAIAYVIAHEVGHHIQNLMGTSAKMRQAQQGRSEAEANKLSVMLELQADFYAGVWAHYNQKYIEEGDIDEAISAANAVGDDAIQKRVQGHIVPDAFTHGTSEQRKRWFMKGYTSGDIRQGNTFDGI
ncbi:MAG: neutral zinc metallopeptidase [Chitinophagales bacterium]|nr:neutral zinc metallopeptidase [Chitinophagales bacterium]